MENQNIALTKRLFEEVFNKGNLNALNEILANNVVVYDTALHNGKGGLREFKEAQVNYHHAFPNMKIKIDDIFGTEDKVFVRWTGTGTHKADLQGIAPTNENVKVTGISINQYKNNKITEIHTQWDRLGLLEQIGQIEPAEALH